MPVESACVFQKHCPRDVSLIRAPKGTTILMAEQRASYVYHLHEGVVGYFQTTADGHEGVAELIVPPCLIGFAGFAGMDGKRRIYHIAEARTITPAVYCRTRREVVWDLMDDREARTQIMDLICGTALIMGRLTGPLFVSDVVVRIVTILDMLTRSVGCRDTNGKILIQGVTHDDVAAMANTTRPTVSRTLERLQRQGILKVERRQIVVIRPDALLRNPWA